MRRCALLLAAVLASSAWADNTVVVIRPAAGGTPLPTTSRNFNGSSDVIRLGCDGTNTGLCGDGVCTICAWLKSDVADVTAAATIYGEGINSGTDNSNNALQISTTETISCVRRNGGTTNSDTVGAGGAVGDLAWHYACCVMNDTTIEAYLDGSTDGSSAIAVADQTMNMCGVGALIRQSGPTITAFWDGSIAGVQVWNAALNTTDMNAAKTANGCTTTNLSSYWPLKGDSPELDLAPSGPRDSISITGTTTPSDVPSAVTSVCFN